MADHSGRAVEGMKYLLSLEHWDRGFEPHRKGMDFCVYSVFVLGSGLATG
jgi:hypothetical protein